MSKTSSAPDGDRGCPCFLDHLKHWQLQSLWSIFRVPSQCLNFQWHFWSYVVFHMWSDRHLPTSIGTIPHSHISLENKTHKKYHCHIYPCVLCLRYTHFFKPRPSNRRSCYDMYKRGLEPRREHWLVMYLNLRRRATILVTDSLVLWAYSLIHSPVRWSRVGVYATISATLVAGVMLVPINY